MKKLVYLLFILTISGRISAQQDPMVSQHMFSGQFINPAYAGSHPYANLTVLGRKQWVGFNGAPSTQFLSFDAPLPGKQLGLGGVILHDVIGVTERTEVSASLDYHLKVGEKAKLSAGLRVGGTYYNAFVSRLKVWDNGDQVFQNDVNGKVLPLAGAGFYFYTPRFFAGLSVPNIINYKPETFLNIGIYANQPFLQRHYIATAGYAIAASPNIDIKPVVLMKYTPNAPLEMDYSLNVLFRKTLWVGGSYRSNDGVVGMVQYQATRNLRIGYAYDLPITKLQNYSSGSHELMLAWDFVREDKTLYLSPRFF